MPELGGIACYICVGRKPRLTIERWSRAYIPVRPSSRGSCESTSEKRVKHIVTSSESHTIRVHIVNRHIVCHWISVTRYAAFPR